MNAGSQLAQKSAQPTFEALRHRGEESFQRLGIPSRKEEAWRFTPLDRLGALEGPELPPASPDISDFIIAGSLRLVFVNGRLDERLSDLDTLPSGCRITPIEGVSEEEFSDRVGSILPPESGPIEALNASRFDHGAVITLDDGLHLSSPLHILHFCDAEEAVLYPRHLILLRREASAAIVEQHVSTAPMLRLPAAEIRLGPGAELNYTRIQDEADSARHIGIIGAQLESRARLLLTSLGLGAGLFRLEMRVTLEGEGAEASVSGLGIGRGKDHREHIVRIDHDSPDCNSHQLFRNILSDSARGVFTGRIVVAPDAQGTDADQSSKSLLLSEQAVALNNPQLEIDADDVRCTHGSTVGELDEEALFYLRARGIGADEARALLTMAFASEVLAAIPIEELKNGLEEKLSRRLLRGESS